MMYKWTKDGMVPTTDLHEEAFYAVDETPQPDEPTLRDQFAMAALTGLVSSFNDTINLLKQAGKAESGIGVAISGLAYEYADAMLEVR